ncbi:hypothetical protein QAD02_015618 [Eretmocerus hayati]|uniref:Uncharacterized protein n=1 Tax=Eretmocerus hayati TaxID=131215 RepID=A0ACC2PA04_9HYME|nr:hypothetical protein QAD02_015618 [Eretmocerus hayati]
MTLSQSLEYASLPMVFHVLTFSGVWCPSDWNASSKLLYSIYSKIQMGAGISLWLTLLINIIITGTHSEKFYQSFFVIAAISLSVYKYFWVPKNREDIQDILKTCFKNNWFDSRDEYEIEIIRRFRSETRWMTAAYAIIISTALSIKVFGPIFISDSALQLPLEAWYPYNVNNRFIFLMCYCHQVLGGVPFTWLHIAVDSLFASLVLQLCTQLGLLKYRLRNYVHFHDLSSKDNKRQNLNLLHDGDTVDKLISAHEDVLKLAKQMQSRFAGVFIGQIMAVIPNICSNVYVLSQCKDLGSYIFIDSVACFLASLINMFIYCWYGNKAMLHSLEVADAVYSMNWTDLDNLSKKKIVMMIIRARRAIQFRANHLPMNIESFISVLNTSYSAFRVLQRTSDNNV